MFRLLLFSFLTSFSISTLLAQAPLPCPSNNHPAEDLCQNICIYCNFNGYSGSSSGYTGQTPPGGFCGTIENEQWLGFIAGAAVGTFTVTPSNCQVGNGLQIALYTDCNSAPVACNGGQPGGGNTPVSITANLTPGVNYFLLIDGYAGDQCNFVVTVTPPAAAQQPPIGPTGAIQGPATVCPGGTVTFNIPPVNGAGFYEWTAPGGWLINGQPSPVITNPPNGNVVTVTVGNTSGQICVRPRNSCNDGNQVCRTINVVPIPPTNLAPVIVCNEDVPYTLPWGQQVNTSGTYQTTYQSYQGCDSVVRQQVTVLPPIIRNLGLQSICAGSCITVCGQQYCDAGTYSYICQSYQGCDSLINFSINVVTPVAEITGGGVITCANPTVTLGSLPSPGAKVWRDGNGVVLGTGNTITVSNPGTVILTVTASAGGNQCIESDTIQITANTTPPLPTAQGGFLGCGNAQAQLNASSNIPNSSFAWGPPAGLSNPNIPNPLASLPGTYTVTVTNPTNGCTATATAVVTGNTDPPSASAQGGVITCVASSITLQANTNANGASFAWSGPAGFSSNQQNPTVSAGGTYTVTITNPLNNCTASATASVTVNTTPPQASASGGTISCTSPTVTLSGNSPTNDVSWAWTGPAGFSSNQQNPVVDTAGTYTLVVTNPINGCTSSATASVSGDTLPPNATAAGGLISCAMPTITLDGASATPGASFAWSGPGGFSSNQQDPSVNAVGIYLLTVTGPNACTATATAEVSGDFDQPDATATGGVITCASSTTQISGSSNTPNVIYSWIGPNQGTYNGPTPTVSNLGIYTLIVTAPNGCTATATAEVVPDDDIPQVSAVGGTLTCAVTSVTLQGTSNTPGATLEWTGPDGFSSTQEDPVVSLPGTYVLTATNPANGCTAIATAPVVLDTLPPTAQALGGTITCSAPNLHLQASSPTQGVTWLWNGPSGFSSTQQNPQVSLPGDYNLLVTAPNGCTSSASATVLADQTPPTVSASGGTLSCSVQSLALSASANTTVSWNWTGPSGFFSSEPNPVVNLPGDYQLLATAPNGCTATAQVSVAQDTVAPDIFAQGGTLSCAQPQLQLLGASNTPGANFLWLGPGGLNTSNPTPTVATGGAYTLVVTAPNGCSAEQTVDVLTDLQPPTVFAVASDLITCAQPAVQLQATATNAASPVVAYLWSGPAGFSSTVEDPSVDVPGTYTVVATSQNGCSASATATVDQNTQPPDVSATGDTLTCTITSADITGASSTPGVSFLWTGPGNFSANQPGATVTLPGVYTLLVTAPNGCTATATATVVLDAAFPDLVANRSNDLDCDDLQATLSAQSNTPDVSFAWADASGTFSVSPQVVVSTGGTYTVSVTAPNGCVSTQTLVVLQDITPPQAAALGDTINCISGVGQLSGQSPTSGVAFLWTGPGNFSSNQQNPQVTQPGVYQLTVTGQNGCSSTASATVWANVDAPQVSLSGAGVLTCAVPQLTLRAHVQSPISSGVWTGPGGFSSTDTIITINQPGTYTFTATAANGCVSAPKLDVTQNIQPPQNVVVTGGTISCAQPQIALQASTSTTNVSYDWTGPAGFASSQQNPTVNQAGTYTVLITNQQNGCQATAVTSVIGDFAQPTVSASASLITCAVPSVTISSSASPANLIYQWSGPGITATNQNAPNPQVDAPGTYTVVVRSVANGCTNSTTVTVQADRQQPENVLTAGTTLTCAQPTNALSVTTTTVGATFLWSGPAGFSSNQQNPLVSQPGTYSVVVTNPANGCSTSATATALADQQPPSVTAQGGIVTCATPALSLSASANPTTVSWIWTGPNGFSSTSQTPSASLPGTYTVVATNLSNGCSASATATVLADQQPPQVSIPNPPLLTCNTTQVSLSAQVAPTGSYTYLWTSPDGSISSGNNTATANTSTTGTYTVIVTNLQNGCSASASTTVRADSATISGAQIQPRDVSCFGKKDGALRILSVQGGTPPYLYAIDNGPLSPQVEFSPLQPGKYALHIQDANGCEWTTSFSIGEPDELLVELGPDTTILLGDAIRISLDNVVNFPGRVSSARLEPAEWQDSLGRDLYPINSFRYALTVVDSNGCRASDSRLVLVDKTRFVYIPNVFTPASANENGLFFISARYPRHVVNIKSLLIFDRWGNAVFERFNFPPNDPALGWDGTTRGTQAPPGVYVYYAEVEFVDGETILYKGDVTIVR